jgi:hypothetical protein
MDNQDDFRDAAFPATRSAAANPQSKRMTRSMSTRKPALVWRYILTFAALTALAACQGEVRLVKYPFAQQKNTPVRQANSQAQAASAPAAEVAPPQPEPALTDAKEDAKARTEENAKEESTATDQTNAQASAQISAASAPAAEAAPPQTAASEPATNTPQTSAVAANHGYTVRWLSSLENRDENDGVEIIHRGWRGGTQLIITSSSGVGTVEVQPMSVVWPRQIQLQFQYSSGKPFKELEKLRLKIVNQAYWAGNQTPEPDPADNFAIWQRDGTLRVDLPAGWLRARQSLRIGWADRIRPLPVPSSNR